MEGLYHEWFVSLFLASEKASFLSPRMSQITRSRGFSDLKVPICCLGTMTFGEQCSESESFAILDYALARGVNFIDTAEL